MEASQIDKKVKEMGEEIMEGAFPKKSHMAYSFKILFFKRK